MRINKKESFLVFSHKRNTYKPKPMSKQSKITVKHYLEKKVKPSLVYRDLPLGYPVYYRITYKRKTTNLKSFTGAIMTEKAYEQFNKTNQPNAYETNYRGAHINLKLENELFFIEKALEEMTRKNEDIGAFDEFFIDNLRTFFNDLKESLFYQAWLHYEQDIELKTRKPKTGKVYKPLTVKQILDQKIIETKEDLKFEDQYKNIDSKKRPFLQEQFYYIFNKENSLIYSLNILKEITGFDAFPYIHTNTLKLWHVIGLILNVYPNTIFIDFFINFDIEKIIKRNNNNKTVTNEEIINICNKLKNNHLGIYFK